MSTLTMVVVVPTISGVAGKAGAPIGSETRHVDVGPTHRNGMSPWHGKAAR